jgi:hypothetical protein
LNTLCLEQAPLLALRASPETVAFAQLLALPTVELARLVEREVEENAALELVDEPLSRPDSSERATFAPRANAIASARAGCSRASAAQGGVRGVRFVSAICWRGRQQG